MPTASVFCHLPMCSLVSLSINTSKRRKIERERNGYGFIVIWHFYFVFFFATASMSTSNLPPGKFNQNSKLRKINTEPNASNVVISPPHDKTALYWKCIRLDIISHSLSMWNTVL